MRTLCAGDTTFWEPSPSQDSLAGIPHSILKAIIKNAFECEVNPKLEDHCCNTASPCVVLRTVGRTCVRLLSVCKTWKCLVSEILRNSQYSDIVTPPYNVNAFPSEPSDRVARRYTLGGKYRAYESIECDHNKSVLHAYDYGGLDGCLGKTRVVIKISWRILERYKNEQYAYTSLATTELDGTKIPHMHFDGLYGGSYYGGIVLDSLGPDLERLRLKCPQRRFTAKMTLAVAIQTVRLYEKLHAHGWLHSNAKPGNFAIGPDAPGKASQIFAFDFEYSHRIEPMPQKGVDCIGWNSRFKPVSWDLGLTPSRRDDLEGLAYVFSYLERGSLPWWYSGDLDALWRVKISTPSRKLFEGMDPVYVQYFDEVKALAWGEIPDYDGIVQRFVKVWERRGFGGIPGEIDWWGALNLRDTKISGT